MVVCQDVHVIKGSFIAMKTTEPSNFDLFTWMHCSHRRGQMFLPSPCTQLFDKTLPVWSCHTPTDHFKTDLNIGKHWILGALDWGHTTNCDHVISTQIHGYPHCAGSDITMWMIGTRETTSLLPPLILVSHLPCVKTNPYGIWTHDHSHTRRASYHMATEETLYTSKFHYC